MQTTAQAPEVAPETARHFVNGRSLHAPFPSHCQTALFALGCFWGAERMFWQLPGVWVTAVGYAGGRTRNPTYREVCAGDSGHAEFVLVVHDPEQISHRQLLGAFWRAHDPTQGMRQGNDIGEQYRSMIFTNNESQLRDARESLDVYQRALHAANFGDITTEIAPSADFYYAEDAHQQYLAKHPDGYCGLGGLGVAHPFEDE